MANVYVIRNKINDKVYVGTTTVNLRQRFSQHTKNSTLCRRNYKLQIAIKELGKENFYIELLEVVPEEIMFEKEVYYIKKFNSFKNGYNSTPGGKGGKIFVDKETIEEIIQLYNNGIGSVKIGKMYGVNQTTIIRLLHENGIKTYKSKIKATIKLNEIKDELIKMYNSGYTYVELGNHFKVDSRTIGRWLTRLNAKNKGKGYRNKKCND